MNLKDIKGSLEMRNPPSEEGMKHVLSLLSHFSLGVSSKGIEKVLKQDNQLL